MRRSAVVAAAVMALLVSAREAPGETLAWRLYRSAEGRFNVELPANPSVGAGTQPSEAGPVEGRAFTVEIGALSLGVEHYELPRVGAWLLSSERLLAIASERLLTERHGERLTAEPYTQDGHPGVILRYVRKDLADALEEARLVVVGRRLYIASARVGNGAGAEPDARANVARFFGSFFVWADL